MSEPARIACAFAIPGDLASPSGGYGYDRRLLELLPAFGVTARHLPLPGAFPFPTAADDAAAQAALAAAPEGIALVDGLALGAMNPARLSRLPQKIVALVHHPLGLEAGLAPEAAAGLIANERAALVHAAAVVVTGPLTARLLVADFGVPAERIVLAEPGTEPAPRARGSGEAAPALLAVGSLVPRKGYDVLIAALAPLARLPWRLVVAGSRDFSPATAADLSRRVADAGLATRIEFAGAVDAERLARLYDRADLFVMPSRFEGYGMALTEALARGLPIVTTTGGALAETAPEGAALKVPPGDVAALSAALERAILDSALRAGLAAAAWEAASRLPRWEDTARRAARAIRAAAGGTGG